MSRAFSSLDGLLRLSRTGGVDIRPALLRVITDLFVQGTTHTREEIQQYAELSLRLMPFVDDPTRETVVAKLQAFPGTPIWLLLQARRFLKKPPAPTQAEPESALHDAAPSLRGDEDRVAAMPDVKAAAQSTDAAALTPSEPVASLAAAVPAPTSLQRSIGERFLHADERERLSILLYSSEPEETAEPAAQLGFPSSTVSHLEAAAHKRDPRRFARELQHAFGLSSRIAGAIAHDDSGETLLVVAKAAAMPRDVLLRILLLLNPAIGESVTTVFRLYRLHEAVDFSTALRIMTSWREDSNARPKAQYQSLHADETPSRTRIWDSFRTASQSRTTQAPANPGSVAPSTKAHGTS